MAETKTSKKETTAPAPAGSIVIAGIPKLVRKRKNLDDSSPSSFTYLDFHDTLNKLQQGVDHLRQTHESVIKDNAEMKRSMGDMKRLAEVRINQTAKLQAELESVKKELKQVQDSHEADLQEILDGAKKDAAASIYLARLKMAEEANDPSFDKYSWDVKKWKQHVVDLGAFPADKDADESKGVQDADEEGGGSDGKA